MNNTGTLQLAQSNIFNNTSDFTVNTGGTFNMAGFTDAIGNLAGGGSITNNGGITLDDLAVNATYSGSISGVGGLFLRSNLTSGSQHPQRHRRRRDDLRAIQLDGHGLHAQPERRDGHGRCVLRGRNERHARPSQGHVIQTGGSVTVSGGFRIGHWPNGVSSYTISSGSLALTGTPTGVVNPAGAAEQNGVIYLGIDGTAAFTQTGGTSAPTASCSTPAATPAATDTLTLNGGTMTLGRVRHQDR